MNTNIKPNIISLISTISILAFINITYLLLKDQMNVAIIVCYQILTVILGLLTGVNLAIVVKHIRKKGDKNSKK